MSEEQKPRDIKPASSAEELERMPEFAKAMKGLAQVPKTELNSAIARKKAPKKKSS
jgi:hypothetical protein